MWPSGEPFCCEFGHIEAVFCILHPSLDTSCLLEYELIFNLEQIILVILSTLQPFGPLTILSYFEVSNDTVSWIVTLI